MTLPRATSSTVQEWSTQWKWIDQCESTQDELWSCEPEIECVLTECQFKGRGRRGKTWVSSRKKGLYLSWRPLTLKALEHSQLPFLSLMTGLACARWLSSLGITTYLKWPNDLLIDSKKVGGVLCEARTCGTAWTVCIGIGINLFDHDELPTQATSVDRYCDVSSKDSRWYAASLITFLRAAYTDLIQRGITYVIEQWRTYQIPLGSLVQRDGIQGKYRGIDEEGGLLLEMDTGEIKSIQTGEVELISLLN